MLKICITGHRDLLDDGSIRTEIRYCLQYLLKQDKNIVATSAMAAGTDTIFAEECIDLKIPLTIILPFDAIEYKKDFHGADRERLETILAHHPYSINQTHTPANNEQRNEAYLITGQRLVDDCDIVIAAWDGNPSRGIGGTGDIIAYSRASNKDLHIIRSNRDGAPPSPARIAFNQKDKEAIRLKKRFERAWIGGIIGGLIAAACFATQLIFIKTGTERLIISIVELSLLIASYISLAVFAKRWKKTFLDTRRDAEYLRVIVRYEEANIPIASMTTGEYKPGDDILDIEQQTKPSIDAIANFQSAKRNAWSLAQQQVDYHRNTRLKLFEHKLESVEHWLTAIKILFFIGVSVNFVLEIFHQPLWLIHTLQFIVFLMPPIYAALEGINYFGEWKRNIANSKNMIAELDKSVAAIYTSTDSASLEEQLKRLRWIMELENSDWAVRYDEKEIDGKV